MTAPSAVVDIGTWIERRPGTWGGRPVIKGTRMPVQVVAEYYSQGKSPEEIQRDAFPHLDVAAIYAAITYFLSNRAEIEADIEADRLAFEAGAAEQDERSGSRHPAS